MRPAGGGVSMKFSVVIPYRNARETLPACLEALAGQSFADFEAILVNNNSSDDSEEVVRRFATEHGALAIILAREDTPGASAARNTGAGTAHGDWLVFTDSDCVPEPGWLEQLQAAQQKEPGLSAMAGCIKPYPTRHPISQFLGLFTLPALGEPRRHTAYTLIAGGFPTANLAIQKSLFDALGGFDNSIPYYGEDHDLCRRIYAAGHAIQTVPAAVVRHIHRHTLGALCGQARHAGQSQALMLRRHETPILIVQAPGVRVFRMPAPFRLWVDLLQADKKMVVILLAGLAWPPLFFLALLYLLYLAHSISHRAERRGQRISARRALVFAVLLLVKSAAMTSGRWTGSAKENVICL